MERWSVAFFSQVSWKWEKKFLVPLGSVLERKRDEVDTEADKASLPIIEKISFGGVLSLTEPESRSGYKGRLFWADAGDLVYSKIRVKQGSLALVPAELERITVSAEYPVYRILGEKAVPEYLALLLKSRMFLSLFKSLSHGGSSKTRIPPEEFERQIIPLPPLAEQRAIVKRWHGAQEQIAATTERVEKLAAKCREGFLNALGIQAGGQRPRLKCFGLPFDRLDRWSVEYLTRKVLGLTQEDSGKYPARPLGALCSATSGCTPSTKETRFWLGGIPWVSPKDMKSETIADTADHITEAAVREAGAPLVPARSVLVVMRSGILQRTVPVALLTREASVNQDMRAFQVRDETVLLPEFLAAYLQHREEALLKLVKWSTTVQSLNAAELESFPVPVPSLEVQRKLVQRVSAARAEMARERAAAEQLRQSIAAEVESLILGTKSLPRA